MIHISKQKEPLFLQLKQIEKDMRKYAQEARIYDNSLTLVNTTIRKNQLTIKQLQNIPVERGIYVPIGRAYLRRNKQQALKDLHNANNSLMSNIKELENQKKLYTDKANEKYALLKEGTNKLMS